MLNSDYRKMKQNRKKTIRSKSDRAGVGAERSYPTTFRPLDTIQSSFCITNNSFNKRPVQLQQTPHRPSTAHHQ